MFEERLRAGGRTSTFILVMGHNNFVNRGYGSAG